MLGDAQRTGCCLVLILQPPRPGSPCGPRTHRSQPLLQLDFIRASENWETQQQSEERKRLEEMARAQEERAKALTDAEVAQKREAEASKRAEAEALRAAEEATRRIRREDDCEKNGGRACSGACAGGNCERGRILRAQEAARSVSTEPSGAAGAKSLGGVGIHRKGRPGICGFSARGKGTS